MRLITNAVVLSSLLVAAASLAGTGSSGGTAKKAAGAGSAAGSAATPGSGSAATPAPAPTSGGDAMGSAAGTTPEAPTDLAAVKPEDMPTAIRMRRLEQKTQALKERAWQLKARVQMLKEQMLGGGVGAQATIAHANDMGTAFRLTNIVYTLDGTQIFTRSDDGGETLYKTGSFDVFNGPIAPGNHTLNAVVTYRGHGYGVFEYLSKYTFTAHGGATFVSEEGKLTKVDCRGYEKGGANTPMEQRPAVDCKTTQVSPQKAPEAPTQGGTPGTTPLPASTTTPTGK